MTSGIALAQRARLAMTDVVSEGMAQPRNGPLAMPHVVTAQTEDIPAWLELAAEVEPLFGPMVDDPGFLRALIKNVERGTAFCVRQTDGPPPLGKGLPLLGGLLFSPKPPVYTIGWLAVAQAHRRRQIGQRLVDHGFDLAARPADFVVITFGPDNPEGEPARRFYGRMKHPARMGFHPAERAPDGPEGGSRQVFRKLIR